MEDLLIYVWPNDDELSNAASAFGNVILDQNTLMMENRMSTGYETLVVYSTENTVEVGILVGYAIHRKRIPTLLIQIGYETKHLTHPLLTTKSFVYNDKQEAIEYMKKFLTYPSMLGRIFTIEGGDGAGKQTQTKLLVNRLLKEGVPVETLDFPHDNAMYGPLIREVLSGKFGDIKKVNPLLFSSIYAFNRHDTLPILNYWIRRGKNIILDRYTSANIGHQASKIESEEDRLRMIEALEQFEHVWLGLPRSHRVIYLDLPPNFAFEAMKDRPALDMHEKAGIEYKNRVRNTFKWCCQALPNWTDVSCLEENNKGQTRLSRDQVHQILYDLIKDEIVPLSI